MSNCISLAARLILDPFYHFSNVKLLLTGPNQIDTFIKENGGPGVQHIGLLSKNIFNSVKEWSSNDVAFIKPPQHYYHEVCCANDVCASFLLRATLFYTLKLYCNPLSITTFHNYLLFHHEAQILHNLCHYLFGPK